MRLTRSGGHRISRCRVDILPKYQRQLKALKEKNEIFRNQRVSKRYMLQTLVHSNAEAISIYLLLKKRRKVSGTSSAESNWVGYPAEENIKGESHHSFDVLGDLLKFSFHGNELLGNYRGIAMELQGNYQRIIRKLLGNYRGITR